MVSYFAAYPPDSLSRSPRQGMTIYGGEKETMNRQKYQKAYSLLPLNDKAIVIAGSNPAFFGVYGEQTREENDDYLR
ncbi:MAG: alpha/beta hydrolase [Bacilli bacterium]